MIILMIVGSIFTLLGLYLLYIRLYYHRYAQVKPATVVGMRKVISHNRGHNSSGSKVLYYPIIEYSFEGENYRFRAGGSSNAIFNYKIGKKVKVLSLRYGPESVMLRGSSHLILGVIFSLAGLIACFLGFSQVNKVDWTDPFDLFFNLAPLLSLFFFALGLLYKVKVSSKKGHSAKSSHSTKKAMFKDAILETSESMADENVFINEFELKKEIESVAKGGVIVSMVFFILSLLGCSFFWTKLPKEVKTSLFEWMENPIQYESILSYLKKAQPELIGLCFCLFMSLAGLNGLRYLKKRL